MKPRILTSCLATAAAIGLVFVYSALAQEEESALLNATQERLEALQKEIEANQAHIRAQAEKMAKVKTKVLLGPKVRQDAMSAMRDAAADLRNADGDEAKDKAEARLRELLTKYFEHDMTQRKAELSEMESRLQKLHEQLERRRQKRDEIIDLQVKVLVNQADGLGFFSESEATGSLFMGGQPRGAWQLIGPPVDVPIALPPVSNPFAAPAAAPGAPQPAIEPAAGRALQK